MSNTPVTSSDLKYDTWPESELNRAKREAAETEAEHETESGS